MAPPGYLGHTFHTHCYSAEDYYFHPFAEYHDCLSGHFRCTSGHCVDESFVCDGDRDCMDTSDEQNCTTRYPDGRFCPANMFQCDNTVSGSQVIECTALGPKCNSAGCKNSVCAKQR